MTEERPNPCLVTGCSMLNESIEVCKDNGCPYRWTREERLDRAEREAKDASRNLSREEGEDGGEKVPQRPSLYVREIPEDLRSHLIGSQEATPASPSGARVCGRAYFPLPLSCQGEDPDERR